MDYEREEFKEDMELVLRSILQVSADHTTSTAFEVLITSPTKTTEEKKALYGAAHPLYGLNGQDECCRKWEWVEERSGS